MMAHACNISYSGGGDLSRDCSSKPAWEISSQDPISSNKARHGGVCCHLSVNKMIVVQAHLDTNVRPYSKNENKRARGVVQVQVVEYQPSK
jgi:hypothetical protein